MFFNLKKKKKALISTFLTAPFVSCMALLPAALSMLFFVCLCVLHLVQINLCKDNTC